MSFSPKYLLIVLLAASCSSSKNAGKTESTTQLIDNVKAHIQYLSDDKLEGRRAGSNGEKLAMEYIADKFKTIGLTPKGTDQYYQPFDIYEGRQINAGTQFSINGAALRQGTDFFPFAFSGNKKIEAKPAIAVQEDDMPWFIDLKDALEDNKSNPHFDLPDYIYNNAKKVKERGATAIIIYNTTAKEDKLEFNPKDKSEKLSIPVVYVTKAVAEKYFKDPAATLDIKLTTDLGDKTKKGHNVAGYIDNGAATTIILGAHFDHLGYGEDGNSMIRTGEKLIHNGADDNASGTAALIELARMLKKATAKNHNYLFIAFSGEELGLFGSKYYVENPTIDLKNVTAMINMDMVGRLSDSTRVLTVGGIGTSPQWASLYPPVPEGAVAKRAFIVKIDSSGTGPSDHTSFYRKDIPVLFYFTGLHSDYHKPSDDFDKINYNGEVMIIQHIYNVVESLNDKGKLAFTKTREAQTSTSARFSVSLGIMPDYTYAGTGVRADGVTEGRAAAKAGLKTGDVIVQLGDHNISSMETYMQALGKFKKGDKTKVKFRRGNETLEAPVEF
jgi:aminopeptidase YwaD